MRLWWSLGDPVRFPIMWSDQDIPKRRCAGVTLPRVCRGCCMHAGCRDTAVPFVFPLVRAKRSDRRASFIAVVSSSALGGKRQQLWGWVAGQSRSPGRLRPAGWAAGRPGFPSRRILFLLQDLPSVTCVASCRCGGSDRSDPESCRRQRRKTDHDKKFGSLLRKSHKNGVLGQQCVDQSVTSRP